jgi:hypothetical protein
MRRALGLVLALAAVVAWPDPAPAADRIRVVATINDLRLLAEAVGGDLVEADTLARPAQNPDDLEVRPSHMAKVRRADLLIINGLDVDAWVEAIVVGANNAKVVPGAPGRVDLSRGIPVLEVPTVRVDRSMGDVHPAGNPHYYLDPGLTPQVTATLVDALARVAPQHRATFEAAPPAVPRQGERGPRRLAAHAGAVQGRAGGRVPQGMGLSPGPLRDPPGRHGGGSARHPAVARAPRAARPAHARRADQGDPRVRLERPAHRRPRGRGRGRQGGCCSRTVRGRSRAPDTYFDLFDYNVRALAEALTAR